MATEQPRLRMFAGPNGSGKTTVKSELNRPSEWFGIYINPDDLEQAIKVSGYLNLGPYELSIDADEINSYFANSQFLQKTKLAPPKIEVDSIRQLLNFQDIAFNSYYASVLSDFLRRKALQAKRSFSFETVMSAEDKVQLLAEARSQGYRTYLYYVATDDPQINIDRVKLRVSQGGHDVPEQKITERYQRTLALLPAAIGHADRAFFFDTSGEESWFFARSTAGELLELEADEMPSWFIPIWEQF